MSKKRETVWRDKLVKLFKERNPTGFIWVNGSLFKQGFPDLTLLQDGVWTQVELKVEEKVRKHPTENLSQRQRMVLEQMGRAGGRAYCLVLDLENKMVYVTNFKNNLATVHPQKGFETNSWGWQDSF